MRPKVLMACIHAYTSAFQVGSHHLARQFVKNGYNVAYISAPLSPFHLLKKKDWELVNRFKIYRNGGGYRLNNRLWFYVPLSLFTPVKKPLLQSEFVLRHWKRLCVPNLFKKIASQGFADLDIFYFDNLLAFPLLANIKSRSSVFRIMDNHMGFPGFPEIGRNIAASISRSVDLVTYSARSLASYAERFADKKQLFFLPNGIDFDSFVSGSKTLPDSIRHVRRPIAVYVGAIEAWFDNELLSLAARRLPHISFLIIGPNDKIAPRLRTCNNVHLLGAVDHNELQSYLFNCDVGIIPFDVKRYPNLINGVNPLKMYEYMACGLPVVSMAWDELRRINGPAMLCSTRDEFINAIAHALHRPISRQALIRFAQQNSWDRYFKKLLQQLAI